MKVWVQVPESSKYPGHCTGKARQGRRILVLPQLMSSKSKRWCLWGWHCRLPSGLPMHLQTYKHTHISIQKSGRGQVVVQSFNHSTQEAEASGSLWPGHQQVYKANSRTAGGYRRNPILKKTTKGRGVLVRWPSISSVCCSSFGPQHPCWATHNCL